MLGEKGSLGGGWSKLDQEENGRRGVVPLHKVGGKDSGGGRSASYFRFLWRRGDIGMREGEVQFSSRTFTLVEHLAFFKKRRIRVDSTKNSMIEKGKREAH